MAPREYREPKIEVLAWGTFIVVVLIMPILYLTYFRKDPDALGAFITMGAIGILLALVMTRLAVRAGRDMERRGQSPFIWGMGVLVTFPIGLFVWLFARRNLPIREVEESPFSASSRSV